MRMDELEQLISLHNAYQKHTPVTTGKSFGMFSSNISICKTCLIPVQVGLDGDLRIFHEDVTLAVCGMSLNYTAVFNMFCARAKELDMSQAYSDLVLKDATCCASMGTLWSVIRQIGMPSEVMLVKYIDSSPSMAYEAALAMPELRPRAYQIILKAETIVIKHNYCKKILNHTDEAMLNAAKDVLAKAKVAKLPTDTKHPVLMEDFQDWHDRKLAWER
jgi:hypothetical protein